VHPNAPWTDAENFLPSTNNETVRVPRLVVKVLSLWQARQVSLSPPELARALREGGPVTRIPIQQAQTKHINIVQTFR